MKTGSRRMKKMSSSSTPSLTKSRPTWRWTYGGLIPNIGFNAYGVAQLIDSVYPNDSRIGIPRLVVARAVLSSRTPGGAIKPFVDPAPGGGYNHLIVHESGEIYNVEVSARRFSILYDLDGYVVHTNHYLPTICAKSKTTPKN